MKVLIAPAITPWRGGVAAHDARLALAGHGKTEAEAVSALRAAVEVWCRVLGRQQPEALQEALTRAGIGWENDDGGLAIKIAPAS